MRVIGFTGASGSGKTTAIVALIEHFVGNGKTVGAIKHTHHPLNEEDRGDTAQFRRAGADPVVLAGQVEAVVFEGDGRTRISYSNPEELLQTLRNDVVVVEGFKAGGPWPQIELSREQWLTVTELLEILDRIWRP